MGASHALDRAFELAKQAEARDPSLPLVQEALSTVHLFRKEHDEAIATARRWTEIEPSSADAYAALAGPHVFAGEPARAISLIERAMRLDPFYPAYFPLYVGQARFLMGQYAEAVEPIKRAIVHNPELQPAHVFLAAAYGHLGESELGQRAYAEVRRIYPDFSFDWLRTFVPFKRTSDLERLIGGLRKVED